MGGDNPYPVIPAPVFAGVNCSRNPDIYTSKLDPCFRRDDS